MNPNYPFVAERATHRCEYCHAPEVVFNLPFEVDHVVPPGKGGVESPENWALACRACNLWKSNAVTAVDSETGQLAPLFHPRHHIWEEHFRVQTEAPFRLIGQTPTGRATIEQLKMNLPLQLIARSQWLVLGIFP